MFPRFARGLALVRLATIVVLLQVIAMVVVQILMATSSDEERLVSLLTWMGRLLFVQLVANGLMLAGAAAGIAELSRARLSITNLLISVIGFAVATASMWWSYDVLSTFISIFTNEETSLEERLAAVEGLSSLGKVVVVRDIGYGVGLIWLMSTIRQCAAAADALALRDLAGHCTRMVVVMVVGDLFYQLTWGLGEGDGGLFGLFAALAVGGYWVWCHLKLVRFLEDASYLGHGSPLPVAIATGASDDASRQSKARVSERSIANVDAAAGGAAPARPSAPIRPSSPHPAQSARPSAPPPVIVPHSPAPPPVVIVPATVVPPPVPRASAPSIGVPRDGDVERPRFLK